jgi:hypothetical protein
MSIIDSDLRLQSGLTDSDSIATHPAQNAGKGARNQPS